MCRHLAYLGPPIALSRLLFDPPHSLCHQSWSPHDMRGGGTINADGFGIGWYAAGRSVRYRRHTPIWSDTTLPELAATVTAGAILAAVRSATTGMPVVETAAAPFGGTPHPRVLTSTAGTPVAGIAGDPSDGTPHERAAAASTADGNWLFSHNGVVRGWPGSVAKLAAALPVEDLLTLEAPTDAALLWALVRDRLRSGATPTEAISGTIADVERTAPGSRLNLLLTDGTTIVATTAGHALSVRRDTGSVLVSSEPLDDDPSWQPVPDRTLLIAAPGSLALTPLGDA
jgi:glutamine amidotransferase